MDDRRDELKLYYQSTLTVWEGFCQLHRELYDLTCEEYLTLLESDVEKLESMLPIKEELIRKIGELEKERADLIDALNGSHLFTQQIERAGDLLTVFATQDRESGIPALRNLNTLLLDIIHKIQDQNKKNQQFLNKAMLSLRDLKSGFAGKKQYTTYGADGQTRALNK